MNETDADVNLDADDLPPEPGGEPTRKPRGSKIDDHRSVVGVISDGEVAKRAGVTTSAVAQYRKRLGIRASQPRGKSRAPKPATAAASREAKPREAKVAPKLAPTAPPPKRSGGPGVYGWRVRMQLADAEVERVVLAPNAAEAADRAGGHGEVLSVERLERAIT